MRALSPFLAVAIAEMHLEPAPERPAQLARIDRDRLGEMRGGGEQRGVRHVLPQPFRDHGLDLGDHVAGRLGQLGVGPGLDDPGAQHQRLDLVLVEHQGRQVETLAQGVADARLALDRHPARHQIAHVAVDGPLRHLEFLREVAGADQLLPAHELDDLEQAIGATHGCPRSSCSNLDDAS